MSEEYLKNLINQRTTQLLFYFCGLIEEITFLERWERSSRELAGVKNKYDTLSVLKYKKF